MIGRSPIVILGAGISGLSTSFHIGHEHCRIVEKSSHHGGHAGSDRQMGFIMDKGPHVSFTRSEYVKSLFADNVAEDFNEIEVLIRSYYHGRWIHHPAQYHLWQLGELMAEDLGGDMLNALREDPAKAPENYLEWLQMAFGEKFSAEFPETYTAKYWTVDAVNLTTDWLGVRVVKPSPDDVGKGMKPGTYQNHHYITRVRYPRAGGYQTFFESFAAKARIEYARKATRVSLTHKLVVFADGSELPYERLISTIPLPEFITVCQEAPKEILEAAQRLDCSQVLLVDVFVPGPARVEGHWFYVYDAAKLSARIHYLEKLSSSNVPEGWSGIQVEVYYSKNRPYAGDTKTVVRQVLNELEEMGFLDARAIAEKQCRTQTRWCPYANVIFTHGRRKNLDIIFNWLSGFGLIRRPDDLEPGSNWEAATPHEGSLMMAGRFAEWKYFWSDDCVLRGKTIADSLRMQGVVNQ
jgi:protoporphyrinogen oxidase